MIEEVRRSYLEIYSIHDLKQVSKPSRDYTLNLLNPVNFQLNKFFYKNIGKNHKWVDRLVWTDLNWSNYVLDEKLTTYILKDKNELAGYFELIFHKDIKESEIAYFGILEEYIGKKLGGYLLTEAIKYSFLEGSQRLWVHTCSLDHKYALNNYQSRGMKIFKSEILTR